MVKLDTMLELTQDHGCTIIGDYHGNFTMVKFYIGDFTMVVPWYFVIWKVPHNPLFRILSSSLNTIFMNFVNTADTFAMTTSDVTSWLPKYINKKVFILKILT